MDEFLNKLWGLDRLTIDKNSQKSIDEEFTAIILSTNNINLNRFLSLEVFSKMLKKNDFRCDIYGVQLAQICVINGIKNLQISRLKTIQNLKLLKEASICQNYNEILQFLNELKLIGNETNLNEAKKSNDIFHKNLEILDQICEELNEISTNEILQNRIKTAQKTAKNSIFKISVTGVINSGKSSMLNALINKKILGTSNIPETANLNVIKFSKKPYAIVNFWENCENEKFHKISKKFEIKNQILEINPQEIKNFSGANSGISEFVKFIELGIDAEFLSDGVEIIDTPGLDDAVVKREILTKNFMQNADFTLHLMNVAQSLTKKDTQFIVNTLLNSKIGGFAIVLTHCDLVSQNEIEEAINYTKKSIKFELENLGFEFLDPKFLFIDSISKRGISELKEFLYENFFGENSQKANLIIKIFHNEILLIANDIKNELKFKNSILNNNNFKNLENSKKISAKIENLQNSFQKLNSKIQEILQNFNNQSLSNSLKNGIFRIKDQVINDIKYSQNSKNKLNFDRLNIIILKGFDDIFIDVFREFGQEIFKNKQNLKQNLNLEFDFLQIEQNAEKFDVREFINTNLNDFSYEEILNKTQKEIKNEKNLALLSEKLQKLFEKFLDDLNINSLFDKIAKNEFLKLQNELNQKLEFQKINLQKQQNKLNEILKTEQKTAQNLEKELKDLSIKDKKIDEILKRLKK